MPPTVKKLVANFAPEKVTKNTVRHAEVVEETEHPISGTFYLSKPALAKLGGAPNGLKITVEAL